MARQITIYEEYDDPTLIQKIWEKMKDDYFSVFKTRYPNAGRARYREAMAETIAGFRGMFFYDCGEEYDPLIDEVRGKTLENFIGKAKDTACRFNPMDRTLRYCHAYLLVKYPNISYSLRVNDYANQYAEMLMAKYMGWIRTDPSGLYQMKSLSRSICGVYVNEILEDWPDNQRGANVTEYRNAEQSFGGAGRIV